MVASASNMITVVEEQEQFSAFDRSEMQVYQTMKNISKINIEHLAYFENNKCCNICWRSETDLKKEIFGNTAKVVLTNPCCK